MLKPILGDNVSTNNEIGGDAAASLPLVLDAVKAEFTRSLMTIHEGALQAVFCEAFTSTTGLSALFGNISRCVMSYCH